MKHDITFCVILEPKANSKKILSVSKKLGFSGKLHGLLSNSQIWIFYKDPIMVSI